MQRKVKLYHYQLPLDCAMILRGQPVDIREGWLLELYERSGLDNGTGLVKNIGLDQACNTRSVYKVGRGEIAPLPGFSDETLSQAKQQLEGAIKIWLEQGVVDLGSYCPSVAFGFSMALLELEDGLSQTIHSSNRHHHANRALLLAADLGIIDSKHAELVETSLCKLKIATVPTVDGAYHDGKIAVQLFIRYPQLRLRLDANRRWSLDAALAFAYQIPAEYRQRIDFIEEPCHTPSDCLRFAHETGITIAWDESLRDADRNLKAQSATHLISTANSKASSSTTVEVSAIIIKPMLTGSVAYCSTLIEQAHQHGLTAVISSSLESSFGLLQLARLAEVLTPDAIPGLDTVNVFKQQLVDPWPNCSLPLLPLSKLPVSVYEI